MRLFHSIFMAVVFACIGMPVSFAMTQEEYEECKTNTESKYIVQFYNFEKDSEYIALYESLYAQAKAEYNDWLDETNITSTEGDCTVNGVYSGKYTCEAGQTNRECVPELCWVLQDETASEFIFEQTVQEKFRQQKVQEECGDAPVSETVETEESKKSDDEEEPSVAFNEPNYSFGVDYTPEVIEVDDRRAAVRAYEDYLVKTFCKKDNGHVTISDGGSYQDKITVNCTGWKKDISKPRTAENEHAVALCHARCAGLGQAYESGNFIGTYTSSCKCQTTRAEKRAANQQARDERKAARAEDRAARQEKRADERAARQEERKKEKAVECDGRNPPMDIKQNDLGLWVCVDTDETIKKREEERKNNKTLDAFWNEMEDLERAFNKRVRQLQRQAKKDGGAK